ncbi:hypothetical protein NE237_010488 [Protea cynaroides]|uniref:Uncharacterized protein n=1 Tax=Protea cynaroides TaxID=273540 RepID=A0A9Q0R1A8_9MAGN|nr:hypothetical protein NE237_010488 [Protea cynaroides]
MATFSTGHSFYPKKIYDPPIRPNSRFQICLACSSNHEPAGSQDAKRKNKKEKRKEEEKHLFLRLLGGVEKVGKGLKENLSPKQKGDWKDLMLMSFSFAVYVYISQRIVCAYCAWMSMQKQPW